jgi:hypothetical protein
MRMVTDRPTLGAYSGFARSREGRCGDASCWRSAWQPACSYRTLAEGSWIFYQACVGEYGLRDVWTSTCSRGDPGLQPA